MNLATREPRPRVGIALGAAALVALAWTVPAAAEPAGIARLLGTAASTNPPSFRVVLGLSGASVAVDPVTGRLRQPTPGEMAALSQAMSTRFGAGIEHVAVEQAADGTLTAHLGTEALNVWIASVGPDGRLHSTCVDNPAAAAAALAGGVVLEEQ